MQRWILTRVSCLLILPLMSVAPATPAVAEHADLRVMNVPGGTASSGFEEFFTEYHAMLTGWWRHGNDRAHAGTWQVVGAEVRRPGQPRPHFVITLARETAEQTVLILTFSVPPHAQGEILLAAHAAYDATVGAILGQSRFYGTIEWRGTGGEMVLDTPPHLFDQRYPHAGSAFLFGTVSGTMRPGII